METELVLYDKMRLAIAQCAGFDEAAEIRDRAAQLRAYFQMRDDAESQRKFAEINLRACIRIGELSRDLETAKPGPITSDRSDVISKTQTLENAGISRSTANDYEQLAGGKEQQAQDIAKAAAQTYFSAQQENNGPVTMGGLKSAVRQALTESFGERPTKSPPKREPDLLVHFLYSANWATKGSFDPVELAREVLEPFAQDDLETCRRFVPLLKVFISELEERLVNVI